MRHASRVGENFNSRQLPPYWNTAHIQTPRGQVLPDIVEHINHGAVERDRPISPEFPHATSPTELGSPVEPSGLETIWDLQADKEVYHAPTPPPSSQEPAAEKKRICGLSRKAFWIVFALGLLVIVGLAAGLGAGLGTRKHG